jgi:hypothetical protein
LLKKLIYSINPVDSLQNTPSSLSLPVEKETLGAVDAISLAPGLVERGRFRGGFRSACLIVFNGCYLYREKIGTNQKHGTGDNVG